MAKPRTQYVIITVCCCRCGDGVDGGKCAFGAPAAAATAATPCAGTTLFSAAAHASPQPPPLPDVHSVAQWLMQTHELLRQCVHRHDEAGLLTGGEQFRVVEGTSPGREQGEATTKRVASPPSDAADVENESLVTTAASWDRRKTPPAQNLGVTCGARTANDSDDSEQILCAAGAPSPKYEKDKPVEDNTSAGASGIEKAAAVKQHDAAVTKSSGKMASIKARGRPARGTAAVTKRIDPREAVCAGLLLVGFACFLAARMGMCPRWVAVALLTASLAPLAMPDSGGPRRTKTGITAKCERGQHTVKATPPYDMQGKSNQSKGEQDNVAIAQQTFEEDERELYTQRSKLYKLRGDSWVELGVGDAKFMMSTVTGRIRFVARNELTGLLMVNQFTRQGPPFCRPTPNACSEFCSVWCAWDGAGTGEQAVFAIKFASRPAARAFEAFFVRASCGGGEVSSVAAEKACISDRGHSS